MYTHCIFVMIWITDVNLRQCVSHTQEPMPEPVFPRTAKSVTCVPRYTALTIVNFQLISKLTYLHIQCALDLDLTQRSTSIQQNVGVQSRENYNYKLYPDTRYFVPQSTYQVDPSWRGFLIEKTANKSLFYFVPQSTHRVDACWRGFFIEKQLTSPCFILSRTRLVFCVFGAKPR